MIAVYEKANKCQANLGKADNAEANPLREALLQAAEEGIRVVLPASVKYE